MRFGFVGEVGGEGRDDCRLACVWLVQSRTLTAARRCRGTRSLTPSIIIGSIMYVAEQRHADTQRARLARGATKRRQGG